MSPNICQCGGGRAHHENDTACWCPRCLQVPLVLRCTTFSPHIPVTLPPPPAHHKSGQSPSPSESTQTERSQPGTNASTAAILEHITSAGPHGATAGEITTLLRHSSATTSAALKYLVNDGCIEQGKSLRMMGSNAEDIWVATETSPEARPRQTTLWG